MISYERLRKERMDVKMRGNVDFCYLNCVFELITHRDKMMNQQCDTSLNSE